MNKLLLYTYILGYIFAEIINVFNIVPGWYRIIIGILISCSFIFFCIVNIGYKKNLYIYGLNMITLMFIYYGIMLIYSDYSIYKLDGTKVPNYSNLIDHLRSILPIFMFFYFTKKGTVTQNFINQLFFVLLSCSIVLYFERLLTGVFNEIEFFTRTNNHAYSLVPFIPMLYLINISKKIKTILLFTILIFLLLTAKRGAIIVGIAAAFLYFYYTNTGKFSFNKIFSLFCGIIAIIGLFFYFIRSNEYFQRRFLETIEGNSSHRDILYSEMYNHFINESDSDTFIYGNGAESAIRIFREAAHNDWLEIAINQGMFGIILYAIYWLFFIITIWNMKNSNIKHAATTVFVMYFLMSFFSMSINAMPLICAFVIGYCISTK